MPEIEFLDHADDADETPRALDVGPDTARHGTPAGRRLTDMVRLLAPVLALAAGALALVACWRPVFMFTERFDNSDDSNAFAVVIDGWGRYSAAATDRVSQHGPRYGLAVCVVVALLLFAAVAGVLAGPSPRWRPIPGPVPGRIARPRAGAVARALAVGAFGALAGVLASAALDVQSTIDNYAAQRARLGGSFTVHITHGSFFWFGAAAAGLTVLALVAPYLVSRLTPEPDAEPRVDPLPLPVRPRYVPHADDDVLDG